MPPPPRFLEVLLKIDVFPFCVCVWLIQTRKRCVCAPAVENVPLRLRRKVLEVNWTPHASNFDTRHVKPPAVANVTQRHSVGSHMNAWIKHTRADTARGRRNGTRTTEPVWHAQVRATAAHSYRFSPPPSSPASPPSLRNARVPGGTRTHTSSPLPVSTTHVPSVTPYLFLAPPLT